MSMSMKSFLTLTAGGMLLASQWTGAVDRPNNQKIDPKDPVVMCQKDCQKEKRNESYEGCMLKCNEMDKRQTPAVPYQKK